MAIRTNENIQEIKFSNNGIKDNINLLVEALKYNNYIKKLYLNCNHIGADGAKILGTFLKTNKTKKIIHLKK